VHPADVARTRPAREAAIHGLAARTAARFLAETTYVSYHVLDGHIFGFSLWEASHTYTAEEVANFAAELAQTITADAYPHLYEQAQQHFSEAPTAR
jgi:hypothetical protein